MIRVLGIVLVSAALLTGCSMLSPKDAEVIRYHNFGLSADNACYLETAPGVTFFVIGGKRFPEQTAEYLGNGNKSLLVRFAKRFGDRIWQSQFMPISFDFEAGKYYMVDYDVYDNNSGKIADVGDIAYDNADNLTIKFFIKEISEPIQRAQAEQKLASFKEKQLKLDPYLAFSKETPNYLEGRWVSDTGKTLEFRGNKFDFSKENKSEMSGRFIFDKSTIIIDVTELNSSPNEYMCSLEYKRDGDRLSLSGSLGIFVRKILDDYTRK